MANVNKRGSGFLPKIDLPDIKGKLFSKKEIELPEDNPSPQKPEEANNETTKRKSIFPRRSSSADTTEQDGPLNPRWSILPQTVDDAWVKFSSSKEITLNEVNETFIVPSQVESFICENIGPLGVVDFSACLEIKNINLGNCEGTIILPKEANSLTSFKSGTISSKYIQQLKNYPTLEDLKVGTLEEDCTITLPASLRTFTCASIGPETILYLYSCEMLTHVRINGSVDGIVLLPKSLTDFKGGTIRLVLDMGHCSNLTYFKADTIAEDSLIKFPDNIAAIDVGYIGPNVEWDLSKHKKLEIFKIKKDEGTVYLPSSVTALECVHIGPTGYLNLSQLTLNKLVINTLEGELILPSTLTNLTIETVNEINLNLSLHTNLTHLTVLFLRGTIQVPAGLKELVLAYVKEGMNLDLTRCKELTSLIVKDIRHLKAVEKEFQGKSLKEIQESQGKICLLSNEHRTFADKLSETAHLRWM